MLSGIIAGDNVRRFPQYCASDNQVPAIISGVGAAILLIVAGTLQGKHLSPHFLAPLS